MRAKRPTIVRTHPCMCSVPLPAAVDRAPRYTWMATVPSLGIISCWCGLCGQQDLTGLLVRPGGWRALTLMIKACLVIHPIQYSSATLRNVLRSEIHMASGGRVCGQYHIVRACIMNYIPETRGLCASFFSLL